MDLQCFSEPVSLVFSDDRGYRDIYGSYIQGHSRLRVQVHTELSPVRTVIRCGSAQAEGQTLCFGLPDAGSCTVTARLTWEDGSETELSETVPVLTYSQPRVRILRAVRCNADGEENPEGEYGKVLFAGTVSPLPGGNPGTYSLQYRAGTEENWSNLSLDHCTGAETGQAVFPAQASRDYTLRLRLGDTLHLVVSEEQTLPVAFALADFDRENRAIGLGVRAGSAQKLNVGLDVQMTGHRIEGMGTPEAEGDGVNLGYCRAHFWGPRLLWENSEPEAEFGAASVRCSLEADSFAAVEFRCGSSTFVQLLPVGAEGVLLGYGDGQLYSRSCRVNRTDISFFRCQSDSQMIPTKIYQL